MNANGFRRRSETGKELLLAADSFGGRRLNDGG